MSGCPEWLRQHRMRLDWQTIIKSCYDNMAWEKVKRGWEKAYITNASASEIIFQDIRPAEGYSKIFIQSKTSDNRAKANHAHQALRSPFLITAMEPMSACVPQNDWLRFNFRSISLAEARKISYLRFNFRHKVRFKDKVYLKLR